MDTHGTLMCIVTGLIQVAGQSLLATRRKQATTVHLQQPFAHRPAHGTVPSSRAAKQDFERRE